MANSSWWKCFATSNPCASKSLRSASPKPDGPQNQMLASRQFGFSHRFAHWLVAANWLGLATTYVQAIPLALMVLVKQNGILVLIYLVALIGIIAAGFRVYRFALGNNASLAAGLVASELVWGVTINYLTG